MEQPTSHSSLSPAVWSGLLLFALFIIFPYYRHFQSDMHLWLYYGGSFCSAACWFWIASKNNYKVTIQNQLSKQSLMGLVFILGLSVVLTGTQLFDPIEWKGDESYHIFRTFVFQADLESFLFQKPLLALFLFFIACFTGFQIKKYSAHTVRAFFIWAIGTMILAWFLKDDFPDFGIEVIRYPPFFVLWESLFSNSLLGMIFEEFAHRISVFIPFLGIGIISFIFLIKNKKQSTWFNVLSLTCIMSLPVLRHHATIVYIDPLLSFGITCAILSLFSQDQITQKNLMTHGSWIALMGAIKITAIPFILAFWVTGILFTWMQDKHSLRRFLCPFSLLLITPSVPQLILRKCLNIQPLESHWENFFNLEVWKSYLLGLHYQFGALFLVLALAGLYFAFKKTPVFWISLTVVHFGLYLFSMFRIDKVFIGISRYQLYLAPFFILGFLLLPAGLSVTFGRVAKSLLGALLCILIILNTTFDIRQNPVTPNWMSPLSKPTDNFYPFDKVAVFLNQNIATGGTFLIEGGDYPYNYFFYVLKYSLRDTKLIQSTASHSLQEALQITRAHGADGLIYLYIKKPSGPVPEDAFRFSTYGNVLDVFFFNSPGKRPGP